MPRRSPDATERKRDPERTKARILEAATAEFGAKGYAAARVSAIADRAGVNKQLISYYFGGKEGLYRELSGRWQRQGGELTDGPLAEVVRGFVLSTRSQRDWARLMVWENVSGDDTPDEGDTEFLRAQVEALRARQEAGELPTDLDPACLLLALTAAASATVFMPRMVRRITGEDPESDEFAERYAEQLARLVRHLG
ncbi:TetR/AcrR family transcriptional regulator [Saccharothrix luteola]|uniref:TetR/AcrR family transcriptional regulator n=1 Tax=Saccharothrix luteola TaxID=2893018 RepID=UPI001E47AB4F|nr:TetR/AcrR family transcriptional regulator [Saccharothrix luteola]MCC8251073.1 TetR/AcrR family transcriptional regulator [Saccharothrix luteola]